MSMISNLMDEEFDKRQEAIRQRDSALGVLRMIREILGPAPDRGQDEPRYLAVNLACDELQKYAADETPRVE